MASEYLKWKYRDVRPEEPAELTPAEKRRNWWHYHWWLVALGAVLLAAAASILGTALTRVRPDFQVAYVGAAPLPADTAEALEAALAGLGGDANGDGRAAVALNQYAGTDTEEGAAYLAAARVRLIADLEACDSYLFLLEDPEAFQAAFGVLEGPAPAWSACPVLAGLDLGGYTETVLGETVSGDSQALLAGLHIARRGFETDKTSDNPAECAALWEALTASAAP